MTAKSILALAFGAAFLTFPTATLANPRCVTAGGEATMVTRDLAEFMSKAALKNSIAAKGLKPVGLPKLACKDPAPLTYCIARQQACK